MDIQAFDDDPGWIEYTIPERKIPIAVLVTLVILGELFFPGVTVWFVENAGRDLGEWLLIIAPKLGVLVVMTAIHEGIHYLASKRQGHSPQFGITLQKTLWLLKEPVPYVVTLQEQISRREMIRALIAPLIVIDAIALGALLLPLSGDVIYYAKLVLVVNTAGSMQDLYNVIRLLRLPDEAVFMNIDDGEIRTFYSIQDDENTAEP
jgi:hypothetical protein